MTRQPRPVACRWSGDVAIADFAALDKPTASDLARWKQLSLAGVDVDVSPLKIDIGSVTLSDFFARVIVYSDATLNFVRLLTRGKRGVGRQRSGSCGGRRESRRRRRRRYGH